MTDSFTVLFEHEVHSLFFETRKLIDHFIMKLIIFLIMSFPTLNIAKAARWFYVTVFHKKFLTHFNIEKHLSGSAVVIGVVRIILKRVNTSVQESAIFRKHDFVHFHQP